MRKFLVAGNWKSNGTLESNASLLEGLKSVDLSEGTEVLVCPPLVYIPGVLSKTAGGPLMVGAQNSSAHKEGAYTGECTAGMLKDCGIEWVILGHSERRTIFGETDDVVADKVNLAVQAGLKPVICVGETLQEREAGQAVAVCLRQIDAVLNRCNPDPDWVIAYEPVWAIGTGKTASSDDAQEMHKAIRGHLSDKAGAVAEEIRLLYGGSVKASNAGELFAKPDIDGALVGGASLKADEFAGIIKSAT